jgi:hypothetical protein
MLNGPAVSFLSTHLSNVCTFTKILDAALFEKPKIEEPNVHELGGSQPTKANSSQAPISKIPNIKKGWWSDSSSKSTCIRP